MLPGNKTQTRDKNLEVTLVPLLSIRTDSKTIAFFFGSAQALKYPKGLLHLTKKVEIENITLIRTTNIIYCKHSKTRHLVKLTEIANDKKYIRIRNG